MNGLIIVTHGKLSQELMRTVSLIMGEQPDVVTICLEANDSIDILRKNILNAVEGFLKKGQGCIILTDLMGGSPTNVCVDIIKNENVRVLTGVNLPMVIAALQYRQSHDLFQASCKIREGALKGIVDLKEFYQERQQKK